MHKINCLNTYFKLFSYNIFNIIIWVRNCIILLVNGEWTFSDKVYETLSILYKTQGCEKYTKVFKLILFISHTLCF